MKLEELKTGIVQGEEEIVTLDEQEWRFYMIIDYSSVSDPHYFSCGSESRLEGKNVFFVFLLRFKSWFWTTFKIFEKKENLKIFWVLKLGRNGDFLARIQVDQKHSDPGSKTVHWIIETQMEFRIFQTNLNLLFRRSRQVFEPSLILKCRVPLKGRWWGEFLTKL